MEFNITTPALLFSAVTLLMLAFTNRFLALASLVRQFITIYEQKQEEKIYKQIQNFKIRLRLIKYTQVFGVLSILLCVFSMLLVFTGFILIAEVLFGLSLVAMIVSLFLSLYEIFISIGALKFELEKLEEKK